MIFERGRDARWLYSGGQRRLLTSPTEITELKDKKLVEQEEIELSGPVLKGIPIMPGSALP